MCKLHLCAYGGYSVTFITVCVHTPELTDILLHAVCVCTCVHSPGGHSVTSVTVCVDTPALRGQSTTWLSFPLWWRDWSVNPGTPERRKCLRLSLLMLLHKPLPVLSQVPVPERWRVSQATGCPPPPCPFSSKARVSGRLGWLCTH